MKFPRDLLVASLLSVLALPASGQEATLVIENGRVIVGDGTVLERESVVVGGQIPGLQASYRDIVTEDYRIVTGQTEAVQAVRENLSRGADVIKICSDPWEERVTFTVEEMHAMVEETYRAGRKITAHATTDEAIGRAVEAGVDAIEHGYGASDSTLRLMAERGVALVPTDLDSVTALEFLPMVLLRAATVNAARILDRAEDLGTLEPGKLADLIVVDGKPLEDLSALRNVDLVVKGGEVVVPPEAQGAPPDAPEAAVEAALHGYFAAFKAQDRQAFEPYVTDDFLLYEGGYPVEKARFVETWDPSSPIEEDHEFSDLEIDVFGDVASLSYVLKWLREGEVRIRGRETALARNVDGQWKFVRFHSSWFPPIRPMEPATLDDYVGTYERCVENQDPECFRLRVWREVDNLFIGRADGEPWIAGLRRLELFPAGEDRFYVEVTTNNVEMPRDERGEVTGIAIHFSIQNAILRFERLEESPQEQR